MRVYRLDAFAQEEQAARGPVAIEALQRALAKSGNAGFLLSITGAQFKTTTATYLQAHLPAAGMQMRRSSTEPEYDVWHVTRA